MRRDTWEKEKTREIKEITIKGLEPEVERILQNQKQERRRVEEKFRSEVFDDSFF
jgi:5-azacytidine-induced protein 1